MKKLFLFIAAALVSVGVWAADATHESPSIITKASRTFLNLAKTPSNVTVSTDSYSNYGPGYFISNKNADLSASWWAFTGTFKSSSSSYSNHKDAVGFHAVGSSSSDEFYQILQLRTGDGRMTQMDFYVTGTSQMGFQWKNGGTNGSKYLSFAIYEMDVTGATATDGASPVATIEGTKTSSNDQYGAVTSLDASKYYHVVLTAYGESNCNFYGLTFKHAPVSKAYTVTTSVNDANMGSAASSESSLDEGETATITATPKAGYKFVSWAVEGTGATLSSTTTNPTTLTMGTANATVTATFETATQYAITHSDATNGSYTIKVGDADAVSTNTTAYEQQTVTLAATPSSGYKFGSWSVYKTGDESTKVTVTNNAFTMPSYAVTVSATFVEPTALYDYAVMAAAGNKSFTDEEVSGTSGEVSGKDKTFGTSGDPQLIIEAAGWDKKGNILNSFIKFFQNTTSMSIVIPSKKLATVTIKYGSYNAGSRYLKVDGVDQAKPKKVLDNDITTSNIDDYVATVELTDQYGTLELTAVGGNIYIAYVDVAITGTVTPTALDNTNDEVKAIKRIENGMLIIEKNGIRYNAQGQVIR